MELRILGPLEAVAGGEALDLGAPRQRALLAILAIHVNQVVSLDRLIDLLWGDRPPAAAIGSLQAYVSNLRRILEPERRPRQAASVIVTQAPGYALRLAAESVDAALAADLICQGRAHLAGGDLRAGLVQLDAALQLWRGDALADFRHHDFAQIDAARLDELQLTAQEDRVEGMLRLGDLSAALPLCEQMVARHPLREHLRALHILALYRAGRQVDALRAYESIRQVLADELGVDPGPELRALHHQVLEHDPCLLGPALPQGPLPASGIALAAGGASPVGLAPPSGGPTSPGLPFVGRDRVLARVMTHLEQAGDRPRLVLVGGEPGIGKSRLAEEVARRAAAGGALVAWGRTHEEGMPPLWPWTSVVRSLLGDDDRSAALPELLGVDAAVSGVSEPDLARFRIYDRVRSVIEDRAADRTLLIVLDDLQWADVTSLRLLSFLATEMVSPNVSLVVLFHEPASSDSDLAASLADLARRPHVDRLTLSGLLADDVLSILEAETTIGQEDRRATAAAVHLRTGGNPFFVTELVRLLASERRHEAVASLGRVFQPGIPLVVGDVIRRRLQRLPEDLRAVLGVAAVVGTQVELAILDRVTGVGEERLYELLEVAVMARLVTEPRPGWFGFSHGLVRETLYQDLSLGRRARLHARVAAAIEAVHRSELQPFVEQLAHHSEAAGDVERTARYARLAGEEAERTSSFDEAVRFWEQALDAHAAATAPSPTPADVAERARLLLRLGAAQRGRGDTAACARALDEALAVAGQAEDTALLGDAALAYGEMGLWQTPPYGTVDGAVVGAIERALEETDDDDLRFRARLLTGLAVASYYDEDERRRSKDFAREAVLVARRSGDPIVRASALVELIMMLDGAQDLTEERTVVEELRSVLADAPDLPFEIAAPA
ncbi:MAG: BTAD domain-containing putative transcriptional regulator, partial [Actinomycetota bacterium]